MSHQPLLTVNWVWWLIMSGHVFTDLSDFLDLKTASKMLLMLGSHEIPSKMLLTLGSHKTPSKMLLTLVSHKIPQSVRNLPPPPLQSPGVKVLISIWTWDLITFPKWQARSRKRNNCLHDTTLKLLMPAISNFVSTGLCVKTWLYHLKRINFSALPQGNTLS